MIRVVALWVSCMVSNIPRQLPLFDGVTVSPVKRPPAPAKQKKQVVLAKCRDFLGSLGDTDVQLALLSEMMLDEIRGLIDKLPVEHQQQVIARLTDGYMEKWNQDGV